MEILPGVYEPPETRLWILGLDFPRAQPRKDEKLKESTTLGMNCLNLSIQLPHEDIHRVLLSQSWGTWADGATFLQNLGH